MATPPQNRIEQYIDSAENPESDSGNTPSPSSDNQDEPEEHLNSEIAPEASNLEKPDLDLPIPKSKLAYLVSVSKFF